MDDLPCTSQDNGTQEVYKFYKKQIKKICKSEEEIEKILVDKSLYQTICDEFNKLLIDEILINSEEIRLPYRLGTLRIK